MAASSGRQRIARTLGRRGMLAALITAAGVYAVLLAQAVVLTALGAVGAARFIGDGLSVAGIGAAAPFAEVLGEFVNASLVTALPFAVGVFVGLWQLLPIAPDLRFAHVVARSIAAAAIGWAATLVVSTIVGAATSFAAASLLGDQLAFLSRQAGNLGTAFLDAILTATRVFVLDLPVTVLAGLLLWGFLQRFAPDHSVAGVVDEL